jgi:hypothetical protein
MVTTNLNRPLYIFKDSLLGCLGLVTNSDTISISPSKQGTSPYRGSGMSPIECQFLGVSRLSPTGFGSEFMDFSADAGA